VGGALLFQLAKVEVPIVGHGSARLDPKTWPLELLDDLREYEHLESQGTPIFNEFIDGGFLIWYTPGYRVFVDDRCEVYGGPWLLEYVEAENGDVGGWLEKELRDHKPFMVALTREGSGFDRYFAQHPDWQLVRKTPTASLYLARKTPLRK
jgi:hypothetical protein